MSNSPKQPRLLLITPSVERATADFIEAAGRALESSNLSAHKARQQIDSLLSELWDACTSVTDNDSPVGTNLL